MGRLKHATDRAANLKSVLERQASSPSANTPSTTSAIASDFVLGYKVRVLIHDFLNVTKNPNSERRINSTTDEHYISAPYFDNAQAAIIRAARVDVEFKRQNSNPVDADQTDQDPDVEDGAAATVVVLKDQTFDSALRILLANFIDKRRASGDTRPCGPHHLAPMYASLFGIKLDEVEDDRFLSRLRRAGP